MKRHPELKALLADFLQFLLLRKPEDVVAFAADYFASFSSTTKSGSAYATSNEARFVPRPESPFKKSQMQASYASWFVKSQTQTEIFICNNLFLSYSSEFYQEPMTSVDYVNTFFCLFFGCLFVITS